MLTIATTIVESAYDCLDSSTDLHFLLLLIQTDPQ